MAAAASTMAPRTCHVSVVEWRPSRVALHCGDEPEHGDERVVFGRELPVDSGREGVSSKFRLEQRGGVDPPTLAFLEPRQPARGDELARGLGNHVVVRGRADAAEARQVALMPMDLSQRARVLIEE